MTTVRLKTKNFLLVPIQSNLMSVTNGKKSSLAATKRFTWVRFIFKVYSLSNFISILLRTINSL